MWHTSSPLFITLVLDEIEVFDEDEVALFPIRKKPSERVP